MTTKQNTKISFLCPNKLSRYISFEDYIDFTCYEDDKENYESDVQDVYDNYRVHFAPVVKNLIGLIEDRLNEENIKGISNIQIKDYSVCDYRPSAEFTCEIDFDEFLKSFKHYLKNTSSIGKFMDFVKNQYKSYNGFWSYIINDASFYLNSNKLKEYNEYPSSDRIDLVVYLEFLFQDDEIDFDCVYPH